MQKTIGTLATGLFLIIGSCSSPERERSSSDLKTYDVQEEPPAMQVAPPPPMAPPTDQMSRASGAAAPDSGGPNINVSAAPGVAFNYRYAYRLPNARIAAAQEAHAAMCEKLGIARCRITGMRYSLVNERDVSASLELKLEPAIARAFGKNATNAITDAQGMLVDQQISGIDAGTSIERANRGRSQLQDELDRVTRELARPGLSNVVRDRLLSEAASLRSQIAALGEQKKADEESLATTPMAFYYGSGAAIPGFDEPAPLKEAFNRAAYNFLSAIAFLIVSIATLLPWILLVALAYWAYRRARVRWPALGAGYRRAADEPAVTAPRRRVRPAPGTA